MRVNYAAAAPEALKALAGVNAALLRAGLDKRLMDLLFLRVSQINGCSYCVDMHARDLRQAGESNESSMASPDGGKALTSPSPRRLR
jgi:AhpD family alkylhydroperoxidase